MTSDTATWVQALVSGVLLGVGAAVPIGPVNVEMARRALAWGFWTGACLGLGAVSVDVGYALAAVLGVSVAAKSAWVFWPLAVGGVMILGWLGVMSLREAWRAMQGGTWGEALTGERPSFVRSYVTGVAMTSINPMTLAFWFGGLASQAVSMEVPIKWLPVLAGGVFVGTVSWVMLFSGIMAGLGRWRRPWWMVLADGVGGVLMVGFAVMGVVAMVRRLG